MTFGQKLEELRRKSGMSQDVLAEKLEVSRQAVSKWERDEAMPETDKVVRIARCFGVSTDYLLLNDQQSQPQQSAQHDMRYGTATCHAGSQRLEKFIRRHGYKSGYVLVGVGTILCILALLIFILLPKFGQGFFDPVRDFAGSMGGLWSDDFFGTMPGAPGSEDYIGGFGGILDGGFDSAADQMQQSWNRTTQIMAVIMGTMLLLPGIALVILGIVIVKKGKVLAASGL